MNDDDIKDNQVSRYLETWLENTEKEFDTLEGLEKAQAWTLINELKTFIGRNNFCEKHELFEGAQVFTLPEPANHQTDYLLVCNNESSNPEHWSEVKKDFYLQAGDLAIRR